MADFIRPEARAALWRWRESFLGALCLVMAVWWVVAGGLFLWLSFAPAALGLALLWIGVQRARFRSGGDGRGAVQVVEGQISYFGPERGGAVAMSELERLTLDTSSEPAFWRLDQFDRPPLEIPVNALGADALFDAFSSLPGLRTDKMVAELNRSGPSAVVIWERTPSRPPQARLH